LSKYQGAWIPRSQYLARLGSNIAICEEAGMVFLTSSNLLSCKEVYIPEVSCTIVRGSSGKEGG